MKEKKALHRFAIALMFLYLFMPLIATFLYSIATDWYDTVLPKGLTFSWYVKLFQDVRFVAALGRTLFACSVAVGLNIAVMVVSLFIVSLYLPKLERLLQAFVMLPYAIPGVIGAVGLIKVYSSGPLAISGTVWLLIGAYFVVILPYTYQGTRNSMRTVDLPQLVSAAELLGASKPKAFFKVVLPNILPGVMVSALLSFSVLFGEFVLTNLLVGGYYETVQIYLMRRMRESGHLSSTVVISYYLFVFCLSWIALKLGQNFKNGNLDSLRGKKYELPHYR